MNTETANEHIKRFASRRGLYRFITLQDEKEPLTHQTNSLETQPQGADHNPQYKCAQRYVPMAMPDSIPVLAAIFPGRAMRSKWLVRDGGNRGAPYQIYLWRGKEMNRGLLAYAQDFGILGACISPPGENPE